MTKKLQTILGEIRRELENLYGERLRGLVLYGSQARGEAKKDSDIDVAVFLTGPIDYDREVERTSDLMGEICLRYEIVPTFVFLEPQQLEKEKSPLLINIRREGIRI